MMPFQKQWRRPFIFSNIKMVIECSTLLLIIMFLLFGCVVCGVTSYIYFIAVYSQEVMALQFLLQRIPQFSTGMPTTVCVFAMAAFMCVCHGGFYVCVLYCVCHCIAMYDISKVYVVT